jgi:hypothetical protein
MVARGRKEEVEVLAGKKTETCRNVSPHVTFPGNTLVSLALPQFLNTSPAERNYLDTRIALVFHTIE